MALSRQRRLHLAVNGAIPISDRCKDGDETMPLPFSDRCNDGDETMPLPFSDSAFTVAIPSYWAMRAFLHKHLAPTLGIHMSLHLIFLPMYRGSITLHGIQNARVLLAAALQERS